MTHHNTPKNTPLNASRRRFLRTASVVSGSVGTAAMPFALNLASLGTAAAQTADGYKAIVCLFLYGGNDSSNMILRTDALSFDEYTRLRSVAPESIALKAPGTLALPGVSVASPEYFGGVRPIAPKFTVSTENKAHTYAVHPNMPELPGLFASGRLAILANAGPLVEPLTRAEFVANVKPRPKALGSHNDQQSTWQALSPEGAQVGWGGHLGDMVASSNTNTLFTSISVSGNAVFSAGDTVFQYQVGSKGATPINSIAGSLFGSSTAAASVKKIVTASNQHLFANEYAAIVKRSSDAQAAFQAAYTLSQVAEPTQYTQIAIGTQVAITKPADNSLAIQLQTVARIIGARAGLGAKRQVFFVSLGGFDTHDGQNVRQADLLARVSHALAYFDTALAGMPGGDMRGNVTLFTASDFGRTFTSNGDGTDHGWGSHHLVMGGAVKGSEIYGRFPQFGQGLDDSANNAYLPSMSVDSIGATLGSWFGVSSSDLDTVFPNLRNFNRNLGFLK
jgi:uncharacterized protein (DUF1501 family)